MKTVATKRHKKIKYVLISVMLITLGVIVAVFWDYRQISDTSDKRISSVQDEASTLSMDKVHQTSTRNGIKEWSLDATSVHYVNEKNQAVFQDLSLIFFLKNEKKVFLTANQGILKTDSNDIEVTGHVVLKNGTYRLDTEKLFYDHDSHTFSSEVPVKITGTAFALAADAMSLDLNTNRTLFEGNVRGDFRGNVTL